MGQTTESHQREREKEKTSILVLGRPRWTRNDWCLTDREHPTPTRVSNSALSLPAARTHPPPATPPPATHRSPLTHALACLDPSSTRR